MKNQITSKKIALIADPHIGVNKNSEEFFNIVEEWSDWLIETLVEKKIKEVFILGDWHHYRDEISVNTLSFSSKIMNKLTHYFNVHMLTGNHDCYLKHTSEIHSLEHFKNWDRVHVYDKYTQLKIDDGDKILSIVPWGHDINDVNKSDVVFGHFEINNFKWNQHTACNNGIDSKNFLNKGLLTFSGHFHMRDEKKYKNGTIVYVGSPFQQDFNDVGNTNGFYILDTGDLSYEFIENPVSPKFVYLYVSKIKTMLKKDVIENNFVRIKIDMDITEKQLDKFISAVQKFNPRRISTDSLSSNEPIDIGDISVNIDRVKIYSCIEEYVKQLKIDNESEVLEKTKEFYEQANKKH